jgi:hypothetical protein
LLRRAGQDDAEAFAESHDGRHLYVATGNKNKLLDLDVATGTIVRSLTGIKDVYGLVTR